MKYKVEILKVNDGIVDIPNGCIPIKYDYSYVKRKRDPIPLIVKTLVVLKPINELLEMNVEEEKTKDEKEICSFCVINYTRDKIGIRPICANCLAELYGKAKESHKSYEC